MKPSDNKLQSSAKRLRVEIAELEATLGDKRSKLAGTEAKLAGAPPPQTGLDLLWAAALPKARERSSKHECRVHWNRIPKNDRPTIEAAVAALKSWNRTDGWKSENGLYCPGLHRFIQKRLWENIPESESRRSRYLSAPTKPTASVDPSDIVTDREEIARLLSIRPISSKSTTPSTNNQ